MRLPIPFKTSLCKYLPAKPGALRWLAPQRGLIALVGRCSDRRMPKAPHPPSYLGHPLPVGEGCGPAPDSCPLVGERVASRASPVRGLGRNFRCEMPGILHSRKCQTPSASPAKPGELPGELAEFLNAYQCLVPLCELSKGIVACQPPDMTTTLDNSTETRLKRVNRFSLRRVNLLATSPRPDVPLRS